MATIQVRDLPEESYETLRRRARTAGQSIQAYMRDQLVALADRPTKHEATAAIESTLARGSIRVTAPVAIVDDLAEDRR